MAALMLASADLLLLAPRLSDKAADLECSLTVICNLVIKARSEDEALEIARLICAKLTHQPDEKPTLRIKVLFCLYNLLPSLSARPWSTGRRSNLPPPGRPPTASCPPSRISTPLSPTKASASRSRGTCSLPSPGFLKTRRA
uniref:Clathrin/coatomer adaptor adaptin-like N-terminal domain-containing protein n=1 Tax=Aegilops tauschii subsp. strangulata TaxID=200361 RepID=A0A452XGQ9_AEGTS